jgi:hypothetical protein
MALRVARGLFRLWLVLSVLWIGGVGIVAWLEWPSGDKAVFLWLLAFVPPAFLLALGSALVWASRGFRQQ